MPFFEERCDADDAKDEGRGLSQSAAALGGDVGARHCADAFRMGNYGYQLYG